MEASGPANHAEVIAALAEPSRLTLYRLIRRSETPLGRDELAEQTGLPRSTVAFHLDRLVAVGVLTTGFARRSGRGGPGAGRPAKFYSVAAEEVSASIPPRSYDLAGDLLATAAEVSDRTGAPIRDCLADVAHARGRELADGTPSLTEVLDDFGYEPAPDLDGGLRLTNCPFHRLAARHTALICAANVSFVQGLADGADEDREVWLEPAPPGCCVRIGPGDETRAGDREPD
ncbi:helix-turn-helix transcriptional regulator [Agromyces aerolatus]|uniref:helix-turn-helix transcriptional regulator n=1 Tax=Agromyces sp. LY-1074 TaxID=3074080 RepID=UPI00285C7677|nr:MULTISPECIES: helix-turn-helix domain-containing protein [unclassified Agromyces]MDR5699218.1 helix-turn-helix domain-containing protein [Agromyces sp. LY-1074]MDR5705514.1 helix-turn-helix domain-containing protein [Agromyces sp. LY-1358]